MGLLDGNFDAFKGLFPAISKSSFGKDYKNFAVAEFRRFYSIGGTILANFHNTQTSIDERIFTHILLRSVLENFFWLIYIFDGPDEAVWSSRFDEYMNGFKREYSKLYNDPGLPRKCELEPADPGWSALPGPLDVRSLLAAVKTIRGERLDYLYFTYRITSFDTHGKTLQTLFTSAFNKDCNFPVLKPKETIEIIADSYVVIWKQIKS